MSDNDDLSVSSDSQNKSIEKISSECSLSDESARSNSDASEKEYKDLEPSIDSAYNINSKTNSRVQFIISDESQKYRINEYNKSNATKSIIKNPSPTNNEQPDLNMYPLDVLELQNPNDECLSGITVDSDNDKQMLSTSVLNILEPENSEAQINNVESGSGSESYSEPLDLPGQNVSL